MPGHDIIVIGASAGGVEALTALVKHLPSSLPAAVFVVVHFPPQSTSILPRLLTRAGPLPATHADDGEAIKTGHLYIAPPDFHLLLKDGRTSVVRGPRENHSRPAIDPLFRSAALAYGPRVVGIILSGTLADGAAGLAAVKRRGGVAVVQDPDDAFFPDMPRSALQYVKADHVLPLSAMPPLLVRLASEPVGEGGKPMSSEMEKETDIAQFDLATLESEEKPGMPSVFACPDCGGTLWELQDENLLRFRCRVGHAFSSESLLAAQTGEIETALWVALRTLEERATLVRRLENRARENQQQFAASSFAEQAQTAEHQAALIRKLLLNDKIPPQTEKP